MRKQYPVFTAQMRKTHKILAPTMLPIHFRLAEPILRSCGYDVEVLQNCDQSVINEGLKSVHNDICYPAMLVIGQMLDALKSGKYDPDKTALMITQTGGGCRASNYIFLLRKALENAGFGNVPVISLNLSSMEKNSGFSLTAPMLVKLCYAFMYGDMMMCLYNQCLPYEKEAGASGRALDSCVNLLLKKLSDGGFFRLNKNFEYIAKTFGAVERNNIKKPRVGIVGEIYMKYSPLGNNRLEEFLVNEGAEPVVSGVCDFLLYCFENSFVDRKLYGGSVFKTLPVRIGSDFIINMQKKMIKAVKREGSFRAPTSFDHLRNLADGYIGKGVKMGEGWLLTAEMIELIESGVSNIVCTQPFGCLPNHIIAKGMMRKIKDKNPNANIVAIDYDPSATKINQENRLKLMLSNADGGRGAFAKKPAPTEKELATAVK